MVDFKKTDVITIDATIITGFLILLTLSQTVGLIGSPRSPAPQPENIYNLPDYWFEPIFFAVWAIIIFSISALFEIVLMVAPLRKDLKFYNEFPCPEKNNQANKNIHIPDSASPGSLIAMGLGFAWIIFTFIVYGVNAAHKAGMF